MGDDKPGRLKPTVVSAPARPAKARAEEPATKAKTAAPSARVLMPTAVPGAARERLPVTADDLRRLSPAAAKGVLERALTMLSAFVVEKSSERKAILWGHDLQKAYADTVTAMLDVTQSPIMRKVEGYVGRTLDILNSFDLEAAAARTDGGGLGGLLQTFNRKTDTIDELNAARRELDQLMRLMSESLDELLRVKDELEKGFARQQAIGADAEAASLAALYLSDRLRSSSPAIAERFAERSMSLTQTLAQIRSNDSLRNMQIEQPVRMIGAIQNVSLVTMPDFLSSLAAIGAMAARRTSVTPTETSELTYKLRDIIRQLKP